MSQAMQLIVAGEVLDLLNGDKVRFVSDGWAPAVSALQDVTLGPAGAHGTVDETYTFNITGKNDVGVFYAALAQFVRMWRTARAQGVAPALPQGNTPAPSFGLVKIQLPGSPNPPWYATITDVKMDNNSLVKLPASYLKQVHTSQIDSATVTFTRLGAYQGETPDVVTTASSTSAAPRVATFSSTASEYSTLQAEVIANTTSDTYGAPGLILAGRTAADFVTATGAALVPSGSAWSAFTDPAANRAQGPLARLKFSGVGQRYLGKTIATPALADAHSVAFWLTVRLNGTAPLVLQIMAIDPTGVTYTDSVLITQPFADTDVPQIIPFSTVHLANGMTSMQIIGRTTTAAAGSLDIDRIVAFRQDDAACRVCAVAANNGGPQPIRYRTRNWHRAATGVDLLTGNPAAVRGPLDFDRRADLVSIGPSAALLWLSTGNPTDETWQWCNDDGTPVSWGWTARRWPAALVPV